MEATDHDAVEQTRPANGPEAGVSLDGEAETIRTDSTEGSRVPGMPLLPDIPSGDLSLDPELIVASTANTDSPEYQKLQKRASTVLKLSEENDKLKEELRAMTARLEAAERRKEELQARKHERSQHIMEPPSS